MIPTQMYSVLLYAVATWPGLAGAAAACVQVGTPVARVNVLDHGATGDGKADDTPAIQRALNAAATQGGICYLPSGRYRLDGTLTVPAGVTLKGSYEGVPHAQHPTGTA